MGQLDLKTKTPRAAYTKKLSDKTATKTPRYKQVGTNQQGPQDLHDISTEAGKRKGRQQGNWQVWEEEPLKEPTGIPWRQTGQLEDSN